MMRQPVGRHPSSFVTGLTVAAAIGMAFLGSSVAHAQRIVDAVLAQDRIQLAGGYDVVNPTTEFHPDSPKIVCVFKVEGAGVGTRLRGVWIAEEVGAKAPPNYKIDEKWLALPFVNAGSFSLTRPNTGWPVGSYRLDIYVGSAPARTVKFKVTPKS